MIGKVYLVLIGATGIVCTGLSLGSVLDDPSRWPNLVLTVSLWVCFFVYLSAYRINARLIKDLRAAHTQAFGATLFANLLAERGAVINCDDCGNPMTHDALIDVLPRPDGTWYVGHQSHHRRSDWGMV